jgi:sec-independent protein translocase protein TatA
MIPGLPSVGGMELMILLSIVLLFFGAKRIPDLARSLGKGAREFREGISGAADYDKDELRDREKAEETPSLDGAAHNEMPRVEEVGATRLEQKS